eukprot:CAMPEP_0195641164 /NCGR_PEP_ID=MMETSP0815-20121206/26552_1 /TAXON_ID=97485 /ORGANISM="Prymnesium parvum, Strain Texoma1" /LENGTH=63 /DNA_ID=CAMNT_0040783913 /DNA_START=531 /DNA_END=719 /DNA_ORIENTATION=-
MRRRTSRLLTRLAHALERMRPIGGGGRRRTGGGGLVHESRSDDVSRVPAAIGAGGAATEEWGW